MKLMVFAVFDSAAEAFMNPFFLTTKGQAIRGFSDAVNEDGHQMNKHPQDYTLFHLGQFDQSSGKFDMRPSPDSLGMAIEFVERIGNEHRTLTVLDGQDK